jgi:hypothetical protein
MAKPWLFGFHVVTSHGQETDTCVPCKPTLVYWWSFFSLRLLCTPRSEDKAWFSEPQKDSKSQHVIRHRETMRSKLARTCLMRFASEECSFVAGAWRFLLGQHLQVFWQFLEFDQSRGQPSVLKVRLKHLQKPFRNLSDAHFAHFAQFASNISLQHMPSAFNAPGIPG